MGNCLTTESQEHLRKKQHSRFSSYLETKKKQRKAKEKGKAEDSISQKHRKRILQRLNKDKPQQGLVIDEKQMRKVMDQIFDKYDKDQDGELNLKELYEMMTSISKRKAGITPSKISFTEDEIKLVMSKTDSSGDIALSKQEFYDFYKRF